MVLGLLVALALNCEGPRHHVRPVRGLRPVRALAAWEWAWCGCSFSIPATVCSSWILRGLGQQSPQWINDPQLSLVMVILVYVWKNLGYCAVVYLAGLQSLPTEVMEAASLDGANGFRRFVSISLPLLSPTTFFLLITTLLSSLQAFDLIRIMTPLGAGTSTLIYEAYLQAFGAYNRAGYSAAISVSCSCDPPGNHGAPAAVRGTKGSLLMTSLSPVSPDPTAPAVSAPDFPGLRREKNRPLSRQQPDPGQ